MGLRVPAHFQEMAKAANVRKWVEGKGFPRTQYFETIDIFKESLKKFDSQNEHYAHLALMLACTIDAEESLLTHVLDTGLEIADPDKWMKICTAAGWIILQKYALAVQKGNWP